METWLSMLPFEPALIWIPGIENQETAAALTVVLPERAASPGLSLYMRALTAKTRALANASASPETALQRLEEMMARTGLSQGLTWIEGMDPFDVLVQHNNSLKDLLADLGLFAQPPAYRKLAETHPNQTMETFLEALANETRSSQLA